MFLLTLLAFGGGLALSIVSNIALFDVMGFMEFNPNYQATMFRRYPFLAFSGLGTAIGFGCGMSYTAGVLGAFLWGIAAWFLVMIAFALFFNLPLIVQRIKDQIKK